MEFVSIRAIIRKGNTRLIHLAVTFDRLLRTCMLINIEVKLSSVLLRSNCAQQNMTQVKGVFRTYFRWTIPSLLSAGTTNELLLENNVACDMPGQIPYMSWLILIMPLSTSMLNCAISFGKRRAGELFYSNRST